MDRPKHRRLILLGLAVLACGALLLGWQWKLTDLEPTPPARAVISHELDPPPDRTQPPATEAVVPRAAASPSQPPSTTVGGFRGRCVDAITRRPVKEFEIKLIRAWRSNMERQEEPLTRAFQSEAGRFTWKDVPAETWSATVSAHGYQQFDLGQLKIDAGKTIPEVVMPLQRGYAVRGRVVAGATGAGIPDAWITFRIANAWPYGGNENPAAKSKDDGSFVLDGVPGGDIDLLVRAQEFAQRELEIVVDEKTPAQDISLSIGGTIAGIVTTAAGAPVKGQIALHAPDMSYGRETNDTGRFSFPHLTAGRYSVSTTTSAGSAQQEIVLGQEERKEDIVLTVGGGRRVRGTIRGLRPEQLTRAAISLHDEAKSVFLSARTDEQGAFAMGGVPPGRAHIHVYTSDRQLMKWVDVPVGEDVTVDLVFPSGARLSGRVTQGGTPVAGKNVWMQAAGAPEGTQSRAMTSQDGEYEIEGLIPGEYRVRADEDITRSITIAGDAVLNIDVPSTQVSGRVLEDGSSVPIVGADVYIRGTAPTTAQVHAYRATNHFGEFKMTGIEPGEIVLTVFLSGYDLYREKISYATPLTNKTITLRKGTGVEVRARRASGEPVRGFLVSETIPGNDLEIDLWIALDRDGGGYMPSALAGSRLSIPTTSGQAIVIEEWDGQALDLKL